MRRFAFARVLVAAGLSWGAYSVRAQSSPALPPPPVKAAKLRDDPAFESLRRGPLTIWVLYHEPKKPATKTVALPAVSPEQTSGSFGQTSSSVGVPSSETGQTAGGFGRTSSSVGQMSSATGQTAGSFGVSGTQLNQIPARSRPPQAAHLDRFRRELNYRGPSGFPAAHFVEIADDELEARLAATAGTDDAPDVLLGDPLLPQVWSAADPGLSQRYGARMLGDGVRVAQVEHGGWNRDRPQAVILLKARHPAQAGAYITWLRDGMEDRDGCLGCWIRTPETDAPVEAATRALRDVMSGQWPEGDADPEMARFDARSAALTALGLNEPLDLSLDVAVSDAWLNDRLAVVRLRGTVYNASAFGVVHALAVLRKAADGRWRVLQLTPNLDSSEIGGAAGMLARYASPKPPGAEETAQEKLGVSLAAPVDGDARPAVPELWWDNAGGATLQVVEWQTCGRSCTDSNLFFVPDAESRLHTRVLAQFANGPEQYRWRVWSLGLGGAMALSPWRRLNILMQ